MSSQDTEGKRQNDDAPVGKQAFGDHPSSVDASGNLETTSTEKPHRVRKRDKVGLVLATHILKLGRKKRAPQHDESALTTGEAEKKAETQIHRENSDSPPVHNEPVAETSEGEAPKKLKATVLLKVAIKRRRNKVREDSDDIVDGGSSKPQGEETPSKLLVYDVSKLRRSSRKVPGSGMKLERETGGIGLRVLQLDSIKDSINSNASLREEVLLDENKMTVTHSETSEQKDSIASQTLRDCRRFLRLDTFRDSNNSDVSLRLSIHEIAVDNEGTTETLSKNGGALVDKNETTVTHNGTSSQKASTTTSASDLADQLSQLARVAGEAIDEGNTGGTSDGDDQDEKTLVLSDDGSFHMSNTSTELRLVPNATQVSTLTIDLTDQDDDGDSTAKGDGIVEEDAGATDQDNSGDEDFVHETIIVAIAESDDENISSSSHSEAGDREDEQTQGDEQTSGEEYFISAGQKVQGKSRMGVIEQPKLLKVKEATKWIMTMNAVTKSMANPEEVKNSLTVVAV